MKPHTPRPLITFADVQKTFGSHKVLTDVNLAIQPAAITALIGQNGAGKTTLIRILAGLSDPTQGSVTFDGTNVAIDNARYYRQRAIVADEDVADVYLTAAEYCEYIAGFYRTVDQELRNEMSSLFQLFSLSHDKNRIIRGFSHGMRKKTQLIAVILSGAPLIVIDEPTNGLDPTMLLFLQELLLQLKENGRTILLSTHSLDFAEAISDHLIIIKEGLIVSQGETKKILAESRAKNLVEYYAKQMGGVDKNAIRSHFQKYSF